MELKLTELLQSVTDVVKVLGGGGGGGGEGREMKNK